MNGGDTIYLDRWMRESGLAELLPSLDLVYVGLSAGSLVMSPSVADDFASWTRPVGGEGLGIVDFEIFPHLDNPDLPENTMADAERWAAGLTGSGYAIDDETAIKVVDGVAEVISEGHWRLFVSWSVPSCVGRRVSRRRNARETGQPDSMSTCTDVVEPARGVRLRDLTRADLQHLITVWRHLDA